MKTFSLTASMLNTNKNKMIDRLKTVSDLGFAKSFLAMGKILHEIRQKKMFTSDNHPSSFSKFCKEFSSLPGSDKNKYLLAVKMIKIYDELSIYRRLSDDAIVRLKFDKAYDLARFSQTHSEKDFKSMITAALSTDFKKLRKLMLDQQTQVASTEITTVSYDKEGKEIGRNIRKVKH